VGSFLRRIHPANKTHINQMRSPQVTAQWRHHIVTSSYFMEQKLRIKISVALHHPCPLWRVPIEADDVFRDSLAHVSGETPSTLEMT
jgi:hypothetical protein